MAENYSFNPFLNEHSILLNDNFDPDNNFFDENSFLSINAEYYTINTVKDKLKTHYITYKY